MPPVVLRLCSEPELLLHQHASALHGDRGVAAPVASGAVGHDEQADADAGHDAAGEEGALADVVAAVVAEIAVEAVVVGDGADGDQAGAANEQAEPGPLEAGVVVVAAVAAATALH